MKDLRNNTRRLLKLLAIFLCMLIFSSCANCVSCNFEDLFNIVVIDPTENDTEGDINQIPHETQKQTTLFTEDITFEPPIPIGDLDFEGLEVHVTLPDSINMHRGWYADEAVDELTEAIINRNQKINEELNIDVKYDIASDVDPNFDTGIIIADAATLSALSIRDKLCNMQDKKLFPYFDFTADCWHRSYIEACNVGKRMYMASGAVSLDVYDNAFAIFAAHDIYKEIRGENDTRLMSDIALEGRWTYDEMYKWAQIANDRGNVQGLAIDGENLSRSDLANAFRATWNVDFTVGKDLDTKLLPPDANSSQKFARLMSMFNDKNILYNGTTSEFSNQKYLMFLTKIAPNDEDVETRREIKSFEFYALLPLPKYNADQESYLTYVSDASFIGIDKSISSDKGVLISAYLQTIMHTSYWEVTGYYFNRTLKTKRIWIDYIDDRELYHSSLIEIFDIIIKNIKFDFVDAYGSSISDLHELWSTAFLQGLTPAEQFAAKSDRYQATLDQVMRFFKEKNQ